MCNLSKHMKSDFKIYWALVENHSPSPKIKGVVEDLKGLETEWLKSWTSPSPPPPSRWGHKESKHMVGFSFRGLKFALSIPRAPELY